MRTINASPASAVAAIWLSAVLTVSAQQARRLERAPLPSPTQANPAKAVHHPIFGLKLQQAMVPLKIECGLQFPGQPEKANPRALIEFIQAKLAKLK